MAMWAVVAAVELTLFYFGIGLLTYAEALSAPPRLQGA